ncbi:RNA methyltransferase [Flavobacterium sp.]|uniref:TrmH family RNA methyltransferase n=1 Tax=Flavobacterium sp. TaxID=239 RepID=UPI0026320ABC|nr:RNA methyltransferase [Flavobacterium sp.]
MISKAELDYLHYLETFLTDARKARFDEVLVNRTNHIAVAIEDVYQLHNTSAVLRSCESFGVQQLHVIEERFGKRIDKEIAMGAQKWVDVHRFDRVDACVLDLKNRGYQIVATSPRGTDCDLHDFDVQQPFVVFFGTERHGLSAEVLDQADRFLKIPMVGFTESLNISVSAAIIIQQLTDRIRREVPHWQLDERSYYETKLRWTKASIKDIKLIEERYFSTLS